MFEQRQNYITGALLKQDVQFGPDLKFIAFEFIIYMPYVLRPSVLTHQFGVYPFLVVIGIRSLAEIRPYSGTPCATQSKIRLWDKVYIRHPAVIIENPAGLYSTGQGYARPLTPKAQAGIICGICEPWCSHMGRATKFKSEQNI